MATIEEKKNPLLNLRKFDFSNNNSNSATFKLKKKRAIQHDCKQETQLQNKAFSFMACTLSLYFHSFFLIKFVAASRHFR